MKVQTKTISPVGPQRAGPIWLRYAAPAAFDPLAARMIPWFFWAAALLVLALAGAPLAAAAALRISLD